MISTQRKIRILLAARQQIIDRKAKSLCIALHNAYSEDLKAWTYFSPMIESFPDFDSYKPKVPYSDLFWFDLNEVDKRVEIIDKMIENIMTNELSQIIS